MRTFTFILLFIISGLNVLAANLSNPESVVWDLRREMFYISNVGAPGFPDGRIVSINRRWEKEYLVSETLNDPKGMVILGDRLYVADLNEVAIIDLSGKVIIDKVEAPGSMFLNDICADSLGNLYITDTQMSKIYQMDTATYNIKDFGPKGPIMFPNGIIFDKYNNRLVLVSFREQSPIQAISLTDKQVSTLCEPGYDNLDGITRDRSGKYYFSSWGDKDIGSGRCYSIDSAFADRPVQVSTNHSGPADIFFHSWGDTLVVPNMSNNVIGYFYFAAMPDMPVRIFPPDSTEGIATSIEFRWKHANGAIRYFIEISENESFDPLMIDYEVDFATSVLFSGFIPGKTYYWRMSNCNLIYRQEYTEGWSFSVADVNIDAPSTISPKGGDTVRSVAPLLEWTKVDGVGYEVELADNDQFEGLIWLATVNDPDSTEIKVGTRLDTAAKYFWRVRTKSDVNYSDWTTPAEFNTFNPSRPVLIYPPMGATEVPVDVVFTWLPVDWTDDYILFVYTGGGEPVVQSDHYDMPPADTLRHTLRLSPMTQYQWHVRALGDNLGVSNETNVFITGLIESVRDDRINEFQIRPNPARDLIRIEKPGDSNSFFRVELFDSLGNIILKEKGVGSVRFKCSNLSSGLYFIKISQGRLQQIKPVVITK